MHVGSIFQAFWSKFRSILGAFSHNLGGFLGGQRHTCKNLHDVCEKSVSWSPSWRQDRPNLSQDGAKLPNLAPRWDQDGHLRAQDGQLESILGAILHSFCDLGRNFCDLGREKRDSKKHSKNLRFFNVFRYLAFRAQDPKK